MIELVSYGRPARDALARIIAREKAVDPLAPVTVIVPSNYAGLSVRRALAGEGAVVNVHFMVAARLAELLGAPALAARGQQPLTPWLRLQAVRAALREAPGVFAEVTDHAATPRELQRVFRELREATPAAAERVARTSPRASDVVRLYRRFRALTADFFDETDLLDEAAKNLESSSSAAADTGALVLYLPRKLPPSLARLFAAAGRSRPVHAIIGLTGDEPADQAAREMASRLPGGTDAAAIAPPIPTPGRIVSATDPEEEVREAIRQLMALAAEGTPLHRVAITHNSAESYAGLLDDALSSAGIPHNGPPTRTLAQTIAGRTLLGLPRIAASAGAGDPGFAREVVMDWLTSAPIHHRAGEAPTHRWDEISREAGIVKGAEQWQNRLELHAIEQEQRAIQRGVEGESSYSRTAGWARSLRDFIAELSRDLGVDSPARSVAHAQQALAWLDRYLPERAIEDEAQLEARERVKRQLEEIASLGRSLPPELDLPIRRAEFAAALEEALAVPFGRVGRLGEGVFTGPITLAAEMEFDAVIVLGMVERVFPAAGRDDPILTVEERASSDGELLPGGMQPIDQRRTFLASLLAAESRILSTPRGDLRAQRATQPSRWLLEAATILHGEPVYASELAELLGAPPAWFRVVNSFESALRTAGERASIQEWDLASLVGFSGRLDRHFLLRRQGSNPLARGVDARIQRGRYGGGRLDGWSGKVAAGLAPVPDAAQPISPTALEKFAKCPFQYFLGHILRVGEIERPEEVVTIEPAVIGNIVHEILQRFFVATAARPVSDAPWSPVERAELRSITTSVFAEFERKGVTGKTLTWRAEQARLLRDLDLLLDEEIRERKQTGFRFKLAEAAFGMEASAARPNAQPAATLHLPGGGTVAFRGMVDRVDEGPNGELAITDYKTGSTRSYEKLKPEDPLAGGQFLQLPVYALAFRGQSPAPVHASYWFISEAAGFTRKRVNLDTATYTSFGGIVHTLLETMREGYFPAVPGEEDYYPGSSGWTNCRYCAYDQVCPSANRTEAWDNVRQEPGLAAFAGLAKGEIPDAEPFDA